MAQLPLLLDCYGKNEDDVAMQPNYNSAKLSLKKKSARYRHSERQHFLVPQSSRQQRMETTSPLSQTEKPLSTATFSSNHVLTNAIKMSADYTKQRLKLKQWNSLTNMMLRTSLFLLE